MILVVWVRVIVVVVERICFVSYICSGVVSFS